MTKTTNRFFSMILVLSMVFSLFVMPASAAETDAAAEVVEKTVEEINLDEIELSFDMASLWAGEGVEIDVEDPMIITVEEELDTIKVLNAEGQLVPLTEEEKGQILYMYQQYLAHWEANADILGVQTPFFLSYNDNKDGLGILGEMLVLAGVPVDAVRAGAMKASDITGMIQNFLYGDALGIAFYGQQIKAARDEVMNLIKNSGAQTDAQKYMILNSWLAQNTTFDMPYIMNNGKAENEKPMVAETPVKHENYDNVYNVIYGDYQKQLKETFESQIVGGLKGAMMIEYYKAAIEQIYYQGALSQIAADPSNPTDEEKAAAQGATDAYMTENAEAISKDPVAFVDSQDMFKQNVPVTDAEGNYIIGEDGNPVMMPLGQQLHAGWDATWADWEANGVPGLVGQIKVTAYQAAIKDALLQSGMPEADADAMLAQNADAIAADPYGFCVATFGQEYADMFEAGINDQLKQMDIDPSTETNPEGRVKLEIIVAMQMDTPQQDPMLQKPDGSYMTPNEAVVAFSAQAAAGLTEGVLNYWQGSQFGALGRGTAVCLGYTKAFTYLAQFMHPEIYGVNGAETDMTVAANWKDASELYYDPNGNLNVNQNYVVDTVRISFNANVRMYGITQENFNSDHFWNAVKIDGQWYYIDPCYTDVYTEVFIRDRVETDGYLNHLYFLFSDDTCRQLYSGYYSEIKTLYEGIATDKSYEDSWISRVKSSVYTSNGYAFYIYDSTDIVTLMEDYENNEIDLEDMTRSEVKLVRHKLDASDTDVGGDIDYEALIEFNYKANENADPVCRVFNPADGTMVKNDLLTKLYNQFTEEQQIYSSLAITMALYNGKAYFNLSNCILSYDLNTGAVALVKEYNTIHAKRDKTNPFGGLAFDVVASADQADFTVENRPLAGMTIKNDGKMYVSVATNFAFISGKDPHNTEDQSSLGYEFEESNYNSNYSTYTSAEYDDSMYETFGYTEETNDNDEFMWATNFVETLNMAHVAGTDHSYKTVTVDPTCGRNGYTEERCTTCGISKAGSRVEMANTALKHHYIYFEETYYTINKDTNNWNNGFCYVCTECNFAIEEPIKPEENELGEMFGISYEEQLAYYEEEKAIYDEAVKTAGHVYTATDAVWTKTGSSVTFSKLVCGGACPERAKNLDCLLNDKKLSVTLKEEVSARASISNGYGNCAEGATAVFTATGTAEGCKYEISTTITMKPGEHPFVNGVCAICGNGRVTRISGSNRYKTAFEAADTLKSLLGISKFDNIIVASGTNFADALSGSYLATKKNAPILLVTSNEVKTVVDYILDNLDSDGTVYLLGGSAAVPAAMDTQLTDLEISFKRLSGKTRYETNLAILKEAGVDKEDVLICTGNGFADSLSASALNRPILLVSNTLTDGQKAFLDALDGNKIYIIGGTAAVNTDIASEIATYGTTERIKGSNRYATAVEIAKAFFDEPSNVVLAYAWNFPDGLCGGPLAYTLNAPMLLTDSNDTSASDYTAELAINTGLVMGGASLISDTAVRNCFGMTNADQIVSK